jgi:hypothetical protein
MGLFSHFPKEKKKGKEKKSKGIFVIFKGAVRI